MAMCVLMWDETHSTAHDGVGMHTVADRIKQGVFILVEFPTKDTTDSSLYTVGREDVQNKTERACVCVRARVCVCPY